MEDTECCPFGQGAATVPFRGMILLLDNRDSFIFNLRAALEELGSEVLVLRSDRVSWQQALAREPAGVLVGPGPGTPERAGCSEELIRQAPPDLPVLGVCLGHQALATAFGGRLCRSHELAHGQLREIEHEGRGVFAGLESPLHLTTYNSLVVDAASLPEELEVTARSAQGTIEGLRHRARDLEGIQAHPESVLCVEQAGQHLLGNFVARCRTRRTVH